MSYFTTFLVLLFTTLAISRYLLFPLLFRSLTQFRVSSFSPLSARGVEWRLKSQENAVVPTLRVEKIGWAWGGCRGQGDTGLVVLRVEGVSLRVKQNKQAADAGNPREPVAEQPPSRLAIYKSKAVSWLIHVLIHHYPSFARIVSLHLTDLRLIFDDLDGLETTIREVRLGVKVEFEGDDETAFLPTPSAMASPISPTRELPFKEYKRGHPLESPIQEGDSLSMPGSPVVAFSSFGAFTPNGSPTKRHTRSRGSIATLNTARRRASTFQTKMTSTASQVWTRAIARATGSVTVLLSASDIALILPHSNPAPPMSARPSVPDISANQPPTPPSLRQRASRPTFSSSRPTSFPSVNSLHSIFRTQQQQRYAIPSPEGGYERLLYVEGVSSASLGLGFGPKKGLLGEDTLKTSLDIAKIHTTVGAGEKVGELVKQKRSLFEGEKKPEGKVEVTAKGKERLWSSRSLPRIILRAFESVTLSFEQLSILHYLPSARTPSTSTSSSSTDLASLPNQPDPHNDFCLALEISDLSLSLSAADSTNNVRARNAFGTNASPESKVRGIGFGLSWHSAGTTCIAPGETERSEVATLRHAEFEGLSTWRPQGWSREELLFAGDPNLALIVMRGEVDSVDVQGEVQLLDELRQAWTAYRPRPPKADPPVTDKGNLGGLPPRIRMVMDVGHAMIVLADRISDAKPTLTLESDGLHLGCFTSFSDLVSRRRDRTATRTAYKAEEELRQRREDAGTDVDYAQPPSMLKPQLRRNFLPLEGKLQEDYAVTMSFDSTMVLEPMSLHLSLSGAKPRDEQTFHLASIGRAHGGVKGDVYGRQEVVPSGCEVGILDISSLSCAADLGIDAGVKINLWNMPVIDALVAMGRAHRHGPMAAPKPTDPKRSILEKLPSGITARFSLGLLSVFVGHEDPNPNCPLKLVRGSWLQSSATFEYAYYNQHAQTISSRHPPSSPQRAKLKLPEDITTQALAFYTTLGAKGGRAALVSVTLMDSFIKPIFNGERFVRMGGTSLSHEVLAQPPKQKHGDMFVGWEFRRPKPEDNLAKGFYANNVPPLEVSDTEQAKRPLVLIPHATCHWLVQTPEADAELEHKVTSRVQRLTIVGDMSHVYSSMLALHTIRSLTTAWKRPKTEAPTGTRRGENISMEVTIRQATAHLAFPQKEQLYVYLGGMVCSKPHRGAIIGMAETVLGYVASPREIGSWEELVRIKKISIAASETGQVVGYAVAAEALRVRIPVAYKLSKLVINLNITVKAFKLLQKDLLGKGFATVRKPRPEPPKRIPNLEISIKHVSLEAKDNPIETKLNLIWRAGLVEQEARNALEDAFERKVQIVSQAAAESSEYSLNSEGDDGDATPVGHAQSNGSKLTAKIAVNLDEARYRLDWWKSRSWVRRIRAAQQEQRRREASALRHMQGAAPEVKLPISVAPASQTAPLFRAAFNGFNLSLSDPGMTRPEIIDYMGDVSNSPFREDAEFSLMVPLRLQWSMDDATASLRDYPLPLIRIQPVDQPPGPAWHVDTTFIIAEEMVPTKSNEDEDDSIVLLPCEIIPEACGDADAHPFTLQIAKTIMPVKTYARPKVQIFSERTTEFTWGNSYQPAIQDFMKVVESLSHPPRDPSPRVGFWDKFRLILHWRVTVDFTGPCHLHLKGSYDPYNVTGNGAGFALSWQRNTRLEIGQPNPQYETIQISAEELLIAIPDLSALHDGAAIGNDNRQTPQPSAEDREHHGKTLTARRYTKPCARFLNGVRVGFGFVFERTCRPHSCEKCGPTENLLHRQCRIFDFKKHQDVVLRSPQAIERDAAALGRTPDSYEGFRSDWIHFSVSLVAPTGDLKPEDSDNPDKVNSLHFSPKAFAHFFAWWKLFDHTLSLPIRQGKLFPDSPPPSKKFGRSLGTIKYRFDLAPVYVSHMYSQVSQELWAAGVGQSLGVKARFGRFRADAHQRAQEKMVRHEKLHRTNVVVHKPFYAADLLLDDLRVKGIRADFTETSRSAADVEETMFPKASELPKGQAMWFNFFDFIDADRRPFDHDPRLEIVDVFDCPQMYYSRRVKARQTTPNDDDNSSLGSSNDVRLDIESSKFGHEKSHICYLGAAGGVGPTQIRITKERITELESRLDALPKEDANGNDINYKVIRDRLKTLNRHLQELSEKESRHIDDDTLQSKGWQHPATSNHNGELNFENTFHVHCPKIMLTNASRNIAFKYWFSNRDRKREEYCTSHASLRGIRDGISRRMKRIRNGLNQDDLLDEFVTNPADVALDMLRNLERCLADRNAGRRFRLPEGYDSDSEDLRRPSQGLPSDCVVKPKHQFLFLKPQIALRSEVDDNAIVLLAVEEISFKGFQVLDEMASDDVAADVLNRNYVSMKGLQAFYPNEDTMNRERNAVGIPRGLDFLPLEIFLDVRSEATDYDRIVLKTDAAISFDKFNHLRMPRGLEWPEAQDDDGEAIQHLRIHQDQTTIVVPRLTVSATSKHYTALYNVVTDLLMYQDPEHRHRSDRVDSFIFAFDRKDRNPHQLLMDLFSLQCNIRSLTELQRGYEANVDLLTEEGKSELFKIRTDLLEATEQLFTVFEAIAVNQARDDARNALKSAARMDVRVGGMTWHMLRDNLKPLVKLDIQGALLAYLSNKDGSTDNALAIGDLMALNSNEDALYPEVMVRYEPSGSNRKKAKESFASCCWSILAPVGGIPIVRHFAFYLHPVRFKLEERLGHAVVDYIFNDRVKRRQNKQQHGDTTPRAAVEGVNGNLSPESAKVLRTSSGMEVMPPLSRSRSSTSVVSMANGQRSVSGMSVGAARNPPDDKFTMVPMMDAAEMKKRASANKTFIMALFGATSFVLSYKSDETKKHGTFSMPDCVDFKLKTPEMAYHNKVWGYEDVFEHIKRDIRSYAWSQTGDLLSQIIKKTSVFRSKKGLKQIAGETLPRRDHVPLVAPSRLRYNVEPPTPAEEETGHGAQLLRKLSRSDPTTPLQRVASRLAERTSPSMLQGPVMDGPEDEDEDEHGMGKAVKGFLGRLKTKHSKVEGLASPPASRLGCS